MQVPQSPFPALARSKMYNSTVAVHDVIVVCWHLANQIESKFTVEIINWLIKNGFRWRSNTDSIDTYEDKSQEKKPLNGCLSLASAYCDTEIWLNLRVIKPGMRTFIIIIIRFITL